MFKVIFQNNNFDKNLSDKSYGLLIGKSNSNFIDVFVALECPEDKDLEESDKTLLERINPKWIGQHAFNTLRMVPGGVEIVGFYFVDSAKTQKSQKLEQILEEIYNKEVAACYDLFSHDANKIYVQLNSNETEKKECKLLKFSQGNGHTFSNVNIECNDVLSNYYNYQSNISIKIDAILPTERDKERILKQLKDAVNPFINEFVSNSSMLINNQLVDNSGKSKLSQYHQSLNTDDKSQDIAAGDFNSFGSNDADVKVIDIVFIGAEMSLESGPNNNSESSSETGFEMINRLKIQGRIPGFAFLSNQATVLDAEQALKRDLTKSLFTRLELLAEELHITGGEIEVSQMLLPQRVLLNLPGCGSLPISDYKFLSETPSDVITRIRYFSRPAGLRDEDIGVSCINNSSSGLEKSEQTSLEDELSEVEAVELEKELANPTMSQTHGMIMFIGLSGLVFILSLLSYYMLN